MVQHNETELFYKLKGKHRGGCLYNWTIHENYAYGYTKDNPQHVDDIALRTSEIVDTIQLTNAVLIETMYAYVFLIGKESPNNEVFKRFFE